MHFAGPYQIPFPYEPYALQVHAMTELRRCLSAPPSSQESKQTQENNNNKNSNNNNKGKNGRVIVLESPTGTGKSQMLLNGVLSHLFSPVYPSSASEMGPVPSSSSPSGVLAHGPERHQADGLAPLSDEVKNESMETSPSASPALEDILRERRIEEEAEALRAERKARVKAHRRQLRAAKKFYARHMQEQQQNNNNNNSLSQQFDTEGAYLLEQNLLTWMAEHQPSSFSPRPHTAFSSSSSSSSSTDSGSEEEAEEKEHQQSQDMESAIEGELATLVPLRKPKLYVASRTHTQLQQLLHDFEKTDFARWTVQRRHHAEGDARPARTLTAIQVGGRSQLCLNRRVRKQGAASASMLNYYCREAMRYERSKEGRANRRAQERSDRGPIQTTSFQHAQEKIENSSIIDVEDSARSFGKGKNSNQNEKGCAYCAERRLVSLLEYIKSNSSLGNNDNNSDNGDDHKNTLRLTSMLTMETLRKLGEELEACPYLATRVLVRGADIVAIPYGYLIDESQRAALLGGLATNAASEEEAKENGLPSPLQEDKEEEADAEYSSSSPRSQSIGSLLYHRQKRVTAMAAFHQRRRQLRAAEANHNNMKKLSNRKNGGEEDDLHASMWKISARCAPPCFTGDILVFDEAHNLADQCRATTAISISERQLRLTRGLLQHYLNKYESRLLTKNKQQLRELSRLIDHVVRYGTSKMESDLSCFVLAFHTFLFDAHIDNFDVYKYLLFLTDSQLTMKLQGFVTYCLEMENAAETAKVDSGLEEPSPSLKRRRGDEGEASKKLTPKGSVVVAPSPDSLSCILQQLAQESNSSATLNSRDALRAVAADSLQRFFSFLQWMYLSTHHTQVLFDSSFISTRKTFSLKLVQLEPGPHTLLPLIRESSAVVLAGGTMQPLALSCKPLLPPSTSKDNHSAENLNNLPETNQQPKYKEEEEEEAVDLHLISEGHVVPPSSVQVWALGKGPSGQRVELSHHALSSSSSSPHFVSPYLEMATLLLNMSRVLPPAGVICFFTSYEAEVRFVEALHQHGYYDQINAVKKIFREGAESVPSSSPSQPSHKGSTATDAMLAAYREWILGREEKEKQPQQSSSSSSPPLPRRGALLFAVMGGRLSEGINFADDLGRAVVVFGLPYANPTDVEMNLYLHHVATTRVEPSTTLHNNNNNNNNNGGTLLTTPAEWSLYTDGCMRTVNQCVGRCIRHARDYAVVLLVDARYAERREVRGRISPWMQPSVRVASNFGECFSGVRQFFADRKEQDEK